MTRKPSQNEIAKVLVVSTGHLAPVIATGDDPPMNAFASMTGDHGWLVHTGADHLPVTIDEPAGMQQLRDVLTYAKKNSCAYVLFDADGPRMEQFPTYEW